jgi:quinol-cytochrome oxidoreductase complex cytochrome b subunit
MRFPSPLVRGLKAVFSVPGYVGNSFFRSAHLTGARRRVALVFNTFFLHFHPVRVHPHSLKPTYTLGLGLITFFLFILTCLTGILLTFYYVPTTGQAYASMQDLVFVVTFGRLVRNLHRWAAEAMVITVALHLLRVFFTSAYKPPREFNWVVGVGLLALTLALSFTGYLLPWDQLSYWAVTVGTNIAAYFPVVGGWLRYMLLGGETVGDAALLRFYVLHVILLPALLATLAGYHFWRIRKDRGLARPADAPRRESMLSFPRLMYVELAVFVALLVVFLALGHFLDAPLGPPADPNRPPNPAKAPWYFVGFQELVSYSAVWGGSIIPILLLAVLLLLPYLDRDPRGVGIWFARERRGLLLAWSAAVVAVRALTVVGALFRGPNWGFYWPWQGWPGPR